MTRPLSSVNRCASGRSAIQSERSISLQPEIARDVDQERDLGEGEERAADRQGDLSESERLAGQGLGVRDQDVEVLELAQRDQVERNAELHQPGRLPWRGGADDQRAE